MDRISSIAATGLWRLRQIGVHRILSLPSNFVRTTQMHKFLLLTAVSVFAGAATAFAASPVSFTANADHTILHAHPAQSHFTPPLAHRPGAPVIYQNFATSYPKGLYDASAAFALSGPETLFGQLWLATAFTPATSATVSEVDLPVGITFGAHNKVKVHIYADANGKPGVDLWTREIALTQTLGECCNITAVHLKPPVQLTAGKQYWLGLTTLKSEPDVLGFWNLDVLDQVDTVPQAVNRGKGWVSFQQPPTSAFGIYGK
jgi:hypothetical protein